MANYGGDGSSKYNSGYGFNQMTAAQQQRIQQQFNQQYQGSQTQQQEQQFSQSYYAQPSGENTYAASSGSPQSPDNYAGTSTGLSSDDPMVAKLSALGIPANQEGETFFQEEMDVGNARGNNPFSGWAFPKGQTGNDFWQLYSLAEKFAANAGWKGGLPSPQQLSQDLANGLLQQDELTIFQTFAQQMGISSSEPWAANGMSRTQWNKANQSFDEMSNELLGTTWDKSGLDPSLKAKALANGWSETDLKNHIISLGLAKGQYSYLRHNMSYQDFQNYKSQNADSLRSRFGESFTDTQANMNLDNPLFSFHAQGVQTQQAQAPQGQQKSMQRQTEFV